MRVLGLDPGPTQSALVVLGKDGVLEHQIAVNSVVLGSVCMLARAQLNQPYPGDVLIVEQIANMGMPAVGESIFETVFWAGRLAQAWADYSDQPFYRLKRYEVKLQLCGSMRAKDANIRQALIDRFGGKAVAIGSKSQPGPLYGVKGDCWQALGVALAWLEINVPTATKAPQEASV